MTRQIERPSPRAGVVADDGYHAYQIIAVCESVIHQEVAVVGALSFPGDVDDVPAVGEAGLRGVAA